MPLFSGLSIAEPPQDGKDSIAVADSSGLEALSPVISAEQQDTPQLMLGSNSGLDLMGLDPETESTLSSPSNGFNGERSFKHSQASDCTQPSVCFHDGGIALIPNVILSEGSLPSASNKQCSWIFPHENLPHLGPRRLLGIYQW